MTLGCELRITCPVVSRHGSGVGVGVTVGVAVAVGVGVEVDVAVGVDEGGGVSVSVAVAVGQAACSFEAVIAYAHHVTSATEATRMIAPIAARLMD